MQTLSSKIIFQNKVQLAVHSLTVGFSFCRGSSTLTCSEMIQMKGKDLNEKWSLCVCVYEQDLRLCCGMRVTTVTRPEISGWIFVFRTSTRLAGVLLEENLWSPLRVRKKEGFNFCLLELHLNIYIRSSSFFFLHVLRSLNEIKCFMCVFYFSHSAQVHQLENIPD